MREESMRGPSCTTVTTNEDKAVDGSFNLLADWSRNNKGFDAALTDGRMGVAMMQMNRNTGVDM